MVAQARSRVKALDRADQLPAKDLEAVQAVSLLAAKVETEILPEGVRIAAMVTKHVEVQFPLVPAVLVAKRVGQSPVEGVALDDPEQLERNLVDEMGKLVDLIVEQPVTKLQLQLLLDEGDAGQLAKQDQGHAVGNR